jgi:purine-nucleoside phosphorylase
MQEDVRKAADEIRELLNREFFDTSVVLGSGWSEAAKILNNGSPTFKVSDITGFRQPAVPGHDGSVGTLSCGGLEVLSFAGRTHLYEGHGVAASVFRVAVAKELGCRSVVLTNGCGSTSMSRGPGTPVLISDHINMTGCTPLSGPTFVDMTSTYNQEWRAAVAKEHTHLEEGVYMQFSGPQYETPAEVRMAHTMGADLVGMSTALEAIYARSLGMEVLGLSLVTNYAAGLVTGELSHNEVTEAGKRAAGSLVGVLETCLKEAP